MMNNVLYCVSSIVELTNILLCYKYILQAPITKKIWKIALVYVGMIAIAMVGVMYGVNIQNLSIDILYCALVPIVVMDKDKMKWMLLFVCAFMISSIMNVTISFIVALYLKIPQAILTDNIMLYVPINSVFSIIILTVVLIRKIMGRRREYIVYWNTPLYIATSIGATVFMLLIGLVQSMGSVYQMRADVLNILGLLMSLATIVFFVLFLWLAVMIFKNETMRNEKNMLDLYLAEQEKNIKLILEKERDMRKFRHDVKEHMNIIGQCIGQKNYEEAQIYVQRMTDGFERAQMKHYTGITTIDAILSDKEHGMTERGIRCNWQINLLKLPSRVEEYDICTVLINILNNAMEACEGLIETDKEIHIKIENIGERLYLWEQNECQSKIQFDKERNPISTKQGANHGLGSKNIRSVVEKYQGELNYQVTDRNFSIEIIL